MVQGLFILLGVAWVVLVIVGAGVLAYSLAYPPRMTSGTAIARGWPTDPSEAGAADWKIHESKSARGATTEYWDVAGDDPHGPVVLMLHGWGDGRIGALQWLDALRAKAGRVWFYDLRGHGDDDQRFTWGREEIHDVCSTIHFIKQYYPQRRVILFGYSFGAVLAMAAANLENEQVSGVIADSPYETLRGVVTQYMRSRNLPVWPVVGIGMGLLRTACGACTDAGTSQSSGDLRCPLLVLHGGKDELTPPSEAEAIARAAPAGRFELFDDCDHLEACLKHSEHYATLIARFIARATA